MIESYLAALRSAERSGETIRLYARCLTAWRDWRAGAGYGPAVTDITTDELRAYVTALGARTSRYGRPLAPATRSSAWRAIRAWGYWVARETGWDAAAVLRRVTPPRVPRAARVSADPALLQRLLAACAADDAETGARNRAILLLLWESGARVAEVCRLTDAAVELARRRAWVTGKGGRRRLLCWGGGAAAALAQYLLCRRGGRGGERPLLRGTSARNNGGALTPDAVRSAIKRLAASAGVALPPGAPLHSFRHAFARRAIRAGGDISDVAQLLGHADVRTTMIYLTLDDERLQATYERIFRPSPPHAAGDDPARATGNQ